MLRLFLICMCTSLVAMPVAQSEDNEVGLTSFDELRDQGLLYARKRRPKLAMKALNSAYAMPEGRTDFKTVYHRGMVARDLLLIEVAYEMAEEPRHWLGRVSATEETSMSSRQSSMIYTERFKLNPLKGRRTAPVGFFSNRKRAS